jgi:Holliday junction resolvase RusA-like endonuclease
MTAEGKALKEQYQWKARSQWKGSRSKAISKSRSPSIFGTKRRADLDNFNKLSLDGLTGIAYLDDSQIAKLSIARAYDKERPRIEVQVAEHSTLLDNSASLTV